MSDSALPERRMLAYTVRPECDEVEVHLECGHTVCVSGRVPMERKRYECPECARKERA
jgi:hypothetical protein